MHMRQWHCCRLHEFILRHVHGTAIVLWSWCCSRILAVRCKDAILVEYNELSRYSFASGADESLRRRVCALNNDIS